MTGLMISRIAIRNKAKLGEYLTNVQSIAAKHGAELVFHGAINRVLNGEPDDHDLLVVVRFPSAEAASALFDHPDYHALIGTREAGAAMEMVAYEQLAA